MLSILRLQYKSLSKGKKGGGKGKERKKEREKGGKERRKHEGMCFNGVGEIQFIIGM